MDVGVTGFTTNALSNGKIAEQTKIWFGKVLGQTVEKRQYNDDKGRTCTEYEFDEYKIKEVQDKQNGDEITIENLDKN